MIEYNDNFFIRVKNSIICNFKEKFFSKKIKFNFPKNINRLKVIQYVVNKKNYKSYLEIGCDDNAVFAKIKVINKIGIDPVKGGNYRGTSDNFFKKNKKKFDCIFIDGLHEFNQVTKDIENSINVLNKNGIIFIHDTMPRSKYHQAVPRCKPTWNGDVWKSIVYFRSFKNLDIFSLEVDQGITLIKKKYNYSILNYNKKQSKNLSFKDFYHNHKKYLNIKNISDIDKFI